MQIKRPPGRPKRTLPFPPLESEPTTVRVFDLVWPATRRETNLVVEVEAPESIARLIRLRLFYRD